MASRHAVQTQGNFQGGVWDSPAHGRFDHPWHRAALETSTNGLPIESGGWIKRSGTQWLGPTYKRLTGYVRTFFGNSSYRFSVVLTTDGSTGWAHFFNKESVLVNASAVVTISSSSSGVVSVTTDVSTGWSVNDQVIFYNIANATAGVYLNRWLTITAISGTSITLKDDQGNAFSFDGAANALAGATINRIARYTTGFTSNLATVQIVNIGILTYGGPITALLLCSGFAPQKIEMTVGNTATIAVSVATFTDGPYLAAQPDTGTVSGYSGSIAFTPATTTFVAADVGRAIRLYSEPAAWNSATAYVQGDLVTYNSKWWKYVGGTAYASISGVVPGTLYTTSSGVQVTLWAPHLTAGQWAYGTITAQAGTSCTVSLTTNLSSANGVTITSWRLGSFVSTASAYPTCGMLYEGRLYLGGARDGRIDASTSGSLLTFSPTNTYGDVFDNHGFSQNVSSESQDAIRWFKPDRSGLLFGTAADEWLLNGGGGANDIITPTNFLFRKMSRYGSLSAPGTTTAGFSFIFTHAGGDIVYEYVTDAFTTAPSGRVLNEFSRSLVAGHNGITELAYTESHVPVVWAVGGDGTLLSCTYRRFSRFMSSPPDMAGWADHNLADLRRLAVSVCAICYPGHLTDFDYLYITTTTTGATSGAGFANGVELLRSL